MNLNKEIRYGTAEHQTLRDAILTRKRMSENKLRERRRLWAEQDDQFQLYVRKTNTDQQRDNLKSQGKPQYVTLEVPYSYAMLLSTHTYLSSVFLSRNPIHQFIARHGQPEEATLGLEALIDYQVQVGAATPAYYVWLHDMLKYGIGIIGTYWCDDFTTISEIVQEPVTFMGIPILGKTKKVRRVKRAKSFSGNRIYNVRPADWYPDPRVTLGNFQQGEFCGRYVEVGWNTILRGKDTERYYNLNALAKVAKSRSETRDPGGVTSSIPDISRDELSTYVVDSADKGFFGLLEMEIELIPADWKLGESTLPEKWIFTLANDEVIIESRPCGEYHGKFNFDVLEYEIEGYNLSKRGMLEVAKPLNDTMTWLFNTHFFNVRKTLNDQLIVDPSRVVMKDLTDPNPGRLIRLRPEAYGTDPRAAVSQLVVNDITRGHMADASLVADFMQRLTGAVDNIMGMVNTGGRKTATEVRSSTTFGINRLKTLAEYGSAVGFSPHAQKLVQNTQQYYDEEQVFRVAGDLAPQVQKYMRVSPEMIQGFYDFVPVDGTMPVDRFAMANLWKDILVNLRQMPEVGQQYSIPSMFAWMSKLAGMRNVEQFRINIAPASQLQQEAQNGNIEPVGNSAGTTATTASVARPSQVAGMGPAA